VYNWQTADELDCRLAVSPDGRIHRMANSEYVWWIAERLPPAPSGGVQGNRLTEYGSFPDKESAERKIKELKRSPHYSDADLVASKQLRPSPKPQR
jgi:hypothetical protein